MKNIIFKLYTIYIMLLVLCRPYVIKVLSFFSEKYFLALTIAVIFTVVVYRMRRPKLRDINKKTLIICILFFLISLFNNAYLQDGRYAIYAYYLFSVFFGVIYVLLKPEKDDIKLIFKIIIIFSFLNCVVSWLSYFFNNIYTDYLIQLIPNDEKVQLLYDFNTFRAIPGLTDHYSRNAFYIILGLLSTFYFMKKERVNQYKYYMLAIFFFFTLLMIGKRGHLIFFIISLLITFILCNKITKALIKNIVIFGAIFLVAIGISFFTIPAIKNTLNRFTNSENFSSGRSTLYSMAIEMYRENNKPIGWGHFSKALKYKYVGVHNDYIQMFIETGLIGTLVVLIANTYYLVIAYKYSKENNKRTFAQITLFYNIFFLTYSLTGIPHYDFETNLMYFLLNSLLIYSMHYNLDYNEKVIGIITLNGYNNYGNRLQNYALTKILEKQGYSVYTIWKKGFVQKSKDFIKCFLIIFRKYRRFFRFYKFSRSNMKETTFSNRNIKNIDYFVIGSDQVWNQNEINRNEFLLGIEGKEGQTISYSASVGINYVSDEFVKIYKNKLSNIKAISVREKKGVDIISKICNRKDIELVADPTLLLTKKEWSSISKKPCFFDNRPYILLYFLGDISKNSMSEIQKLSKKRNLRIINIMDLNHNYYTYGPREFIYLIEHAELICTDSFHASVFSFIFDKSFIIFKRDTKSMGNMLSRMTSLTEIYKLSDRLYNDNNITEDNLKHDYSESYKILEHERVRSINYLINTLEK